jgi:hypothetical protein
MTDELFHRRRNIFLANSLVFCGFTEGFFHFNEGKRAKSTTDGLSRPPNERTDNLRSAHDATRNGAPSKSTTGDFVMAFSFCPTIYETLISHPSQDYSFSCITIFLKTECILPNHASLAKSSFNRRAPSNPIDAPRSGSFRIRSIAFVISNGLSGATR